MRQFQMGLYLPEVCFFFFLPFRGPTVRQSPEGLGLVILQLGLSSRQQEVRWRVTFANERSHFVRL